MAQCSGMHAQRMRLQASSLQKLAPPANRREKASEYEHDAVCVGACRSVEPVLLLITSDSDGGLDPCDGGVSLSPLMKREH